MKESERKKCLVITGKRKGCEDLVIALESQTDRDELLDGLRMIRVENSMLFKQNLDKMKRQGFR